MKYKLAVLFVLSVIISVCAAGNASLGDITKYISFIHYFGNTFLKNETYSYVNATDIANASTFNKNVPTVIFMHGYAEKPRIHNGQYSTDIVPQGFFKAGLNVNLIVCNYENLVQNSASATSYMSAVYNTTYIGKAIGLFLKEFISACECENQIRLIGFSLGAQIMSYAANTYGKGLLPWLTGLDPAGPGYTKGMMPRLSKNDGIFVQVIHTSGGSLGLMGDVGLVDVRPNYGISPQPSCSLLRQYKCSHYMAPHLFSDSIWAPELYVAVKCDTARAWATHRCDNNSIIHAGYHIETSAKGDYYMRTEGTLPYGLGKQGLSPS